MKHLPIVFSLLSLMVVTAQANDDGKLLSNAVPRSKMEQLAAFFEQGQLPTSGDLVGWYSGRCFWSNNPNIPKNVLMVGKKIEDGGSPNGPIFAGKESVMVSLMESNNGIPASYYDNISQKDKATVEMELAATPDSFLEVSYSDNDNLIVWGEYPYFDRWELRTYQTYKIWRGFKNNLLYVCCYLFKKID